MDSTKNNPSGQNNQSNQSPLTTATQTHEAELDKKMSVLRGQHLEGTARQYAGQLGISYIDLRSFPVDNAALFLLEEGEARGARLAIIAKDGPKLTVAVADPKDAQTKTVLEKLQGAGYGLVLVVASAAALESTFGRYQFKQKMKQVSRGIIDIAENEIDKLQEQIQSVGDLKNKISSIPVTQVLDILIAGALKIGASDIHFEPEEKHVRLRYRLDGVLTDIVTFPTAEYHDILSRVKLNSGLKLNIHNTPQDGRFTIREKNKDIEVRVSILPGAYGENIVMRLLDPSSIRQKLEDLGMRDDTLVLSKKLLEKTTGSILTTGPTGSGKTTTLYAFLQSINSPDIKIITIEDPVEYHIEGISQTQVNEAAGYTFADGLRSIVRQDPDVILVGEIRDKETAEIAMQAALTGHLVLSTVHTNSAAGTIPRLIDLGVRAVTIAPALNAAMAQRLVRRLCQKCKKEQKIKAEDLAVLRKYLASLPKEIEVPQLTDALKIYYPAGCPVCDNTGYKGRVGVYEIFEIDDDMERLILKSPALSEVQDTAVKKGMITLLQDGLLKAANGTTSIDEVMRVIGE